MARSDVPSRSELVLLASSTISLVLIKTINLVAHALFDDGSVAAQAPTHKLAASRAHNSAPMEVFDWVMHS